MILRLKTNTEKEMMAAFKGVLRFNKDGKLITNAKNYFVYLMPRLLAPTGEMIPDGEGGEYPEKLQLDGYHANVSTKDKNIAAALKHVTVRVKSPLVKMSGEI